MERIQIAVLEKFAINQLAAAGKKLIAAIASFKKRMMTTGMKNASFQILCLILIATKQCNVLA